MSTSPILLLTELANRQANAEALVNRNIRLLESFAVMNILDRDLTAPPGGETDGDAYIIAAGATGSWASKDGQVAVYQNGYYYFTPAKGMTAWVDDESKFFVYDGSSWSELSVASNVYERWTEVASAVYTSTPASTSQLSMSDTSAVSVQDPIRYTIGGTIYYGVVETVTANTSIDIIGAPLSGSVTKLEVGRPEMLRQVSLFISGVYANATQDLLSTVMNASYPWKTADAYLIELAVAHATVDSGTQPTVGAKIGGTQVTTVQVSGTANTYASNSAVDIDTAAYDILEDELLELAVTTAGGTGDAENLTAHLLFLIP